MAADDTVALLEAVIRPGDKLNIEGDNQKQADFLAECLCKVDPAKVHDLHMVQSVLSMGTHLDVFDKGIAKKLDFSFSGRRPAFGRVRARGQDRDRRHPHLPGAVRPLLHGPHAARGADRGRERRQERQPVHGLQHRGHARHRGGDQVQAGHRGGPGERDRRRGAAGGHPRRLGGLRGAGSQALLRGAAVHARPRPHHRLAGAARHDGDQGHLRRVRHPAPQPRHRI